MAGEQRRSWPRSLEKKGIIKVKGDSVKWKM